jgi:hypothetical protein
MRHYRRARFRNPQYAPEFLERKLSPSTLVGSSSAYVAPTSAAATTTTVTSNPPITYPTPTSNGPSGPS